MAILYGLSAAILFGVADFYATAATRRIGVIRTLFAVQLVGVVAISIVLLLKQEPLPRFGAAWLALAAVSAVSFVGVLFLYRAFSIGTLSIVSPIASGFAVITAALALAFGERPPGLAVAGAVLLIGGIIMVSTTHSSSAATISGVPAAVGAAICFGIYFWAVGELTSKLGVYWPVFITRSVEAAMAGVYLLIRRQSVMSNGRTKQVAPHLIAAGLLDSAAMLTFNLGVDSGYTTTTTALTSLYSAVTVLLAWILLRERLARQQWAGVTVVLVGVLLVSL